MRPDGWVGTVTHIHTHSVCASVCLCLFVCLFVFQSFCICLCQFSCLSICKFHCPYVRLYICPSIYVSLPISLFLSPSLSPLVYTEKINFYRFLAHFRCVHRGAYFTEMRTTAVRKLLPEAWGFLCPVHTPDGTPCGLLNHLAASCEVVNHHSATAALKKFLKQNGLIPSEELAGRGKTISRRLVTLGWPNNFRICATLKVAYGPKSGRDPPTLDIDGTDAPHSYANSHNDLPFPSKRSSVSLHKLTLSPFAPTGSSGSTYPVMLDGRFLGGIRHDCAVELTSELRRLKAVDDPRIPKMLEIGFVPATKVASQDPGIFLATQSVVEDVFSCCCCCCCFHPPPRVAMTDLRHSRFMSNMWWLRFPPHFSLVSLSLLT